MLDRDRGLLLYISGAVEVERSTSGGEREEEDVVVVAESREKRRLKRPDSVPDAVSGVYLEIRRKEVDIKDEEDDIKDRDRDGDRRDRRINR